MLILVLTISAISCASLSLQAVGSPEWLLDRFYSDSLFPEKSEYITGEFAQHYGDEPTIGGLLGGRATVTHRPLESDSSSAVYATSVRTDRGSQDWYTYLLLHEGRWKISAIRSLASTGPIHIAIQQLSGREDLRDSLAIELATMRLVVSSDSAIAQHLRSNLQLFNELVGLFDVSPAIQRLNNRGDVRATGPDPPASHVKEMTSLMRELRLRAVYRSDDAAGCIFFQIGGLGDNAVGYLHAPSGCSVPKMTPEWYIYVERVAPSWYVYKTT